MTDLLLCTLGASWAVIPETLAFIAPQTLPLYAAHPQAAALEQERVRAGLRTPHEVWIITTQGEKTQASLRWLAQWCTRLGKRAPQLRVWQADGTDQLATPEECARLRELTLRLALLARETAGLAGQCVYSLAGGRKTMSADLQRAATIFGADAVLHVVDADLPRPMFARDQSEVVELMCAALPATLDEAQQDGSLRAKPLVGAIRPLLTDSRLPRSELLDIALDKQHGPVTCTRFPLPLAPAFTASMQSCVWAPSDESSLSDELAEREHASARLLGNYLDLLTHDEKHENWRQLYRLPPEAINTLRRHHLEASDHEWLRALPKADLHRHLGGCLDIARQIKVGQTLWAALSPAQQAEARTIVGPWLDTAWPTDWPQRLRVTATQRMPCVAALLTHESPERLLQQLFPVTLTRIALKCSVHGFAGYERPGELSGSALLQHPAAIEPYAAALVAQARAEGLAYVELRGSPQKYLGGDGIGFLHGLHRALQTAGACVGRIDDAAALAALRPAAQECQPIVRFIVIADRRQPMQATTVTELVLQARRELPGFVVGIDLAGDEAVSHLEAFQQAFAPVFRECVPVTIHAGEGETADNIWNAAYALHADRIGHGLTLYEKPELAARFRNRGIAIELCPSSNREVVGYRDPDYDDSHGYPPYPLPALLDAGLPLTLCTDNPGISRTTLAEEYLTAARMSETGLSRWQALALIRQGFVHAFLPADERERLLKAADSAIRERIAP